MFIYIFGKLANKPYNYRYAGGKRVSIYEGQCIIHITTMARALGCSLYAARKALNELAEENMIHKIKAGTASPSRYLLQVLFIKEEKIQKITTTRTGVSMATRANKRRPPGDTARRPRPPARSRRSRKRSYRGLWPPTGICPRWRRNCCRRCSRYRKWRWLRGVT